MLKVFVVTLLRRVQKNDWGFRCETGEFGVFISRIESDSPAHVSGLKCGDRILAVNGTKLAPDSRAWFVDMNSSFGVECRLLIERDPQVLQARASIVRTLSTEHREDEENYEPMNEVVQTLHLEADQNEETPPREDEFLGGFLKRMRLGMPLPGQTANFDISERTRADLSQLVHPETIPEYRSPPERVLEVTQDSRFSDRQLLKHAGKDKIFAPDDYVSNFITISREDALKRETRVRKERLEFKKQGLVLTRRERERLSSFDESTEQAQPSILDADPLARTMLGWIGRHSYHDFS